MKLTSTQKIEKNTVVLEIAVNAEEFKAAVDRAFKKNAPKITLPGFRKGKAPRAMIEKMYGEDAFYEEAVNDLYPKAYADALEESKIEPVDRADIEVLEVSKDGFNFKATVTVAPEVSVKDYKGISATRPEYKVEEAEVEEELKKLQERNGRTISVEDRAAKNGDTVVFDFLGSVDGVPFEGGKAEKFTLVLGSGQFIPGFEGQMEGKKIGEEFDVNVTFPTDYHAEELKGKEAIFVCKMHEIKATELPELDDEFAKDVSEFDTIKELKADIEKAIEERKSQKADDEFENALIDEVIKNLEAEIPEVMVEHRIDEMVNDFNYRLQSQGLNLETYLQYTSSSMDAFRKTFHAQAERQVKIRLALEKIAEIEKLSATDEEVEAEYAKVAESYNVEIVKVKEFIKAKEISKDIAVNKAIDFIRDNADVKGEKPKKKAPAKKDEEKAEKPAKAVKEEKAEKPAKKATKKKADAE